MKPFTPYVRVRAWTEPVDPSPPLTPCRELERLARQVARLSPSHRDPEAFHVSKSEIVAELRRLARALAAA